MSAGNVRPEDLFATANAYPDSLFQWKVHEPAQGANALTVGAYTTKTRLPPESGYEESRLRSSRWRWCRSTLRRPREWRRAHGP